VENEAAVSETADLAAKAIPELEAIGDDRALARAWILFGQMRGDFQGNNAALEEAAARAAEHYRRAGWSPSTCVGYIASALYYGPRAVDDGIARCDVLLREHAGDRASEASILLWLGRLEAMRGNFDDARSTVSRARSLNEDLGQTLGAEAICNAALGGIEVLDGRFDEAETALRASCEACLRANASAMLASFSAKLADVLYALDRLDEAETWCGTSRNTARPDDRDAQSWWRSVESKLAARRGDIAAAEQLAREAVEIVEQTDALNHRAKVWLDAAEVLRAAGRDAEASEAARRGISLYELKGNQVAAKRARKLLAVSQVAPT
jgi:tetratricopeptide (TPR) repeat protein